ncbi:MAG: tyrosine-type recombinase/integrase, partial [Proteobacteria bacterium]|nr:tyrosine-type recombinase/integrase [Pseudomonadota bacterium]
MKHKDVRYEVVEPGRTGLSIRVEPSPSTRKSWYYLYRGKKNGKSVARRMKLGEHPGTSLQEVRALLSDAIGVKVRGGDPARAVAETAKQAEQEAREAVTVATFSKKYLEEKIRGKFASASATENIFDRDILPVIGEMTVKEVRRGHINEILGNIRGRGADTMANRTLSACVSFFGYALDKELIETSPTYKIKRTKELPRNRVMSPDEIGTFWKSLGNTGISLHLQLALRFLLITGQRRAEVVEASWLEIDRPERVWEIPAERTKKERPHVVPLTDMALDMLDQIKAASSGGTNLFPSPLRPECAYSPPGLSKTVLLYNNAFGLGEPFTVHDLRRTVNTEMGRLGIPQYIIDRVQSRVDSSVG